MQLTENDFEYLIKSKIASKKLTMKAFAEIFGTSQANFSQRLKRGSFNAIELYKIADLLDYNIKWEEK